MGARQIEVTIVGDTDLILNDRFDIWLREPRLGIHGVYSKNRMTNNKKMEDKNMAKKIEENVIELKPLGNRFMEVTIVGDSDLVLNKMNDVNAKQLIDERKDKAKDTEKPNVWECIITSMHWYNGKPTDFSKQGLEDALKNNAPCITDFGLKKSFGDAVVRNEIDKYKTKFDANVNVVSKGGLVPIQFAEHFIDEKLMSPKKGSPVLVNLNRFSGWKATFTVSYLESVYSAEQIINIINLAGFGLGIGSGRTSGFGRYHVEDVKAV